MIVPGTYRGWSVSFEYGYFYATSPNYDASWEGDEDGWVDNGERVCGRAVDDCLAEVDAWFDERRHCDDCDFSTMAADVTVCPNRECRGSVG